MTLRVLAVCGMLLALGCSNGVEPGGAPAGYFTAQVTGTQSLRLKGSASTFIISTEVDTLYAVGMAETPGPEERRSVILTCPGRAAPGVGTHAIGHGAECQGIYSRTIGTPSTGLAREDGLDADTGSVTVTRRTDHDLVGNFRLQGTMTSFGYPAGPLTVTGTFSALPGQ